MTKLTLVPIYCSGDVELLSAAAQQAYAELGLQATVSPPWFDAEAAFDPGRSQYNSRLLLAQLLAGGPRPLAPGDRVLGVAGVDLFIPVLTYVFGEAQLAGTAAVVSFHRLRPELYGLAENRALVAERLAKEAVHELGHTYGLLHCAQPRCVMGRSSYVEEIDLKDAQLCPACRSVLNLETWLTRAPR